jgi:hypothetical protein
LILPLVMSDTGLQPQAPADIRAQIVTAVAATNPDFTDNLPGSLIEDVVSTDVAAVVLSDSFLVDLINSITPNGANPYLLREFGELYGLQPIAATNTSVYVVFTGPPGLVIVKGFIVSDGSYLYICQDGGICGVNGQSLPIYAVAIMPGTWPVVPGSVNQIGTSVPSQFNLTVSNPESGFISTQSETIADFRDRVMTAGLAASTGMASYAKTLLAAVPAVQKRLISFRQDIPTGRYVAIIGNGDPYQVAYAMAEAMFWVPGFIAPDIPIASISAANPAVVTTAVNHNLATYIPPDLVNNIPASGDQEQFYGIVANGALQTLNGQTLPVTVIDATHFSVPFDNTQPGSLYLSGGFVTPNPIVEQVTIVDWPDTYLLSYVIPPQETVVLTVLWTTDSPNYVSAAAIAQTAAPALQAYINSLAAGTTPINIYDMTSIFLDSIADILPPESIISLTFEVSINGIGVAPNPGTGVIYGDPNSYFQVDLSGIIITQHSVTL